MEQMRQEDEHQTGAALIQLRTCCCHSGDDYQCCQTCCQCIKECNSCCRSRDVFIIRQVGTINNCTVTCNRQGEECLTQSIDPCHGIFQRNGVNTEDIFITFCCAGLHCNIDRQTNEKNIEQRHHNFIRFFDTFADTQHCDSQTDHQSTDLPCVVTESTCHAAKSTCIAVNIGICQCSTCKCTNCIFQDPAHNNSITDCHCQSTNHGDQT